jgi:hypothetical protein
LSGDFGGKGFGIRPDYDSAYGQTELSGQLLPGGECLPTDAGNAACALFHDH